MDGTDVNAKADMLAASLMGATSFQRLGCHARDESSTGAHLHIHHGLANAIVMPYVLRFNEKAIADRMDKAARYLNLDCTVLEWVLSLREQLGIPNTLAEVGFTESHIAILAPDSVKTPLPEPITLLSEEDYEPFSATLGQDNRMSTPFRLTLWSANRQQMQRGH